MHLTDDQLNEYLDNETAERAEITSPFGRSAGGFRHFFVPTRAALQRTGGGIIV